jgi:hypothetical protein
MRSSAPRSVVTRTVLFVTLGLEACSWAGTAKQRFAGNESCPEDRVIAKRRDDLHASDEFRCERPPVDVWLDPEPRRMWKAAQRQERELLDDGTEVYEVAGCGAVRLYVCGVSLHAPHCRLFRSTAPAAS